MKVPGFRFQVPGFRFQPDCRQAGFRVQGYIPFSAGKGVLLVIMLLCITMACDRFETRKTEKPLARVGDVYLYASDVVEIFPAKITQNDSLLILNSYIDKWIKKQLLLQKAELNLTEKQKDVSSQIEEYRSSLLIFKYEQSLILQKLDTVISQAEIEEYYNENPSNFILDKNLVKALFIKLPRNVPNMDQFRRLYYSNLEEDIQQLESYCYQYATKYDFFGDFWINFIHIQSELPQRIYSPERSLKWYKRFEQKDSTYNYFVYIRDYRVEGETAPIDYVSDKIKSIILNKRKLQFITEMENDIFNDAMLKGEFTIY
jgi:hypothetical protein